MESKVMSAIEQKLNEALKLLDKAGSLHPRPEVSLAIQQAKIDVFDALIEERTPPTENGD